MNRTHQFRLTMLAAMLAIDVSFGAAAALTDIAQTPLASGSGSNLVKPNISYVLDTSGSMQWSHAPDEAQPWVDNVGYKTSQCNSIYYNPNIIYPPARNYDGTAMANSSFTAAPKDGFSSFDGTSSTTVNLSTSFQAYDTTSGNSSSSDSKQAAYYYTYNGTQQPNGLNYQTKTSQFYQECNLQESDTPYSTITFSGTNETAVSSITVNGATITGGSTASAISSSTLASLTEAAVTAAGYSASSSGSVVTINGPASVAGVLPVVNLSPPTVLGSITFSGSSLTSVTGITVNGVQIMSGATNATTSSSTQASNVAGSISQNGFIATSSGSKVTIYGPASAAGYTPAVTMQGTQTSTITYSGSNSTVVTSVTVNGTNILGAPTAASSSSSTVASSTDAGIAASGYSATSSGSKVTITAPPAAAGFTPVVTVVPGVVTSVLTVAGSGSTSVSGITVNGVSIMGSASSSSTSPSTVASNIDAAINQNGFSATSSGSTVTISGPGSVANGQFPVITIVPGKPTATITFSGSSSTSITNVKVNGTTITSSSTATTTSTSVQASNLAGKITLGGYTATASGSVVTIVGPAGAMGFTPVITKSGSMTGTPTAFAAAGTMTVTAGGAFSGAAPMGAAVTAFVSGSTMSASTTPFPAAGTMQAAVAAFSPFVKVLVSSTSGPGSTDERQNFANWYTYYRIRMLMMKSGLGRAFVSIGSNYRVGFMTIYATPSNSTTDAGYLAINDFTTTQKQSWFNKVYSQTPGGGTPLKTALTTAARNMAGKVGPDPQQYSCQQNFILLSTDGYWNSGTPNGKKLDGTSDIGNQDNTLSTAGYGQYDGGLSGSSNTLADVAYYYYNTDLRPSSGSCNTGVSGADVCRDNVSTAGLDNATWQHVTLFTLGLGTNGQLNYATNYLTGGSADYNLILTGQKNWPTPVGDQLTTIDDLWHAAVNGHGQYFSAKNPDLLVSGLNTALAGVSARLAAGAAAATSNLQPVNGDNFAYVGSYTTQEWTGDLQSHSIDLTNATFSAASNWSAQAILDGMTTDVSDTRTIFTFLAGSKVDFVPASFSATQKTNWFTPANAPQLIQYAGWTVAQQTAGTADTVINYLRGQTGNEERGTNPAVSQLYRVRNHIMGDIIDSTPAYVRLPPFKYSENNYQTFKSSASVTSRAGMVYVGANDGMLHAFNGTTGAEVWAYVPSFVLPNLKALAGDDYTTNHKYYVDGSPVIGDIWNGSAWRTILVCGLNAGGKGYFALDVTDPANPTVLWEFSDANLGFSYGNPTINKLGNGNWVVSFTSGYNNVGDGLGRLFVVDAWTGVTTFTISTGVGSAASPSGLGKIAAWTDNGLVDNTMQRIYGGDLFGNLWRFDVNNQYAPAGQDAFLMANFKVGTYQQPITTAPQIALVNSLPVVFVGTGKYLGASDVSDLNQQSFYAILDQLTGTGLGDARTETTCPLVPVTLVSTSATSRGTTSSSLPTWNATSCGWYLDFNPGATSPGERVTSDFGLQFGVLALVTNVPEVSVCTVGGSAWVYFLDYSTGLSVGQVDVSSGNVSGAGNTNSPNSAGSFLGNALGVGDVVIQLPNGETYLEVTGSDDSHTPYHIPHPSGGAGDGTRVMWRELLN